MVSPQTLLRDVFGFDAFRPGQEDVVEAVVEGHNVLAIMPTGGGKSLCFQIPALLREGVTLVVSPLIALMRDQVRGLQAAGVAAGALTSGHTQEDTDSAPLLSFEPQRLHPASSDGPRLLHDVVSLHAAAVPLDLNYSDLLEFLLQLRSRVPCNNSKSSSSAGVANPARGWSAAGRHRSGSGRKSLAACACAAVSGRASTPI